METQEIVHEILDYLHKDRNFTMIKDNTNALPNLSYFASFKIVIEVPENHFAPFFKIQSTIQAKDIVLDIVNKYQPETNVDKMGIAIDAEIKKQMFTEHQDMYLSVFVTTHNALK